MTIVRGEAELVAKRISQDGTRLAAYPSYEIKDRAAIPMTMAMIPIFW